jgi:hypothetical protein
MRKLSGEVFESYGFELISKDASPFTPQMPYYAKNRVLFFFNEGEHNKGAYYFGLGAQTWGKYQVVTMRWIYDEEDLLLIYKAVTGLGLNKTINL